MSSNGAIMGVFFIVILMVVAGVGGFLWYDSNKKDDVASETEEDENVAENIDGTMYLRADNKVTVFKNDKEIGMFDEWRESNSLGFAANKGDKLRFKVYNSDGPGGFVAAVNWNDNTYETNGAIKLLDHTLKKFDYATDPWNTLEPPTKPILENKPWVWSDDECEECTRNFEVEMN